MPSMTDAFIVDGVRTPMGRFGGALADVRPDDLAAHVIRALIERNDVPGLATMCIGVGQGIATIVERVAVPSD